jgi:hypothetical protein
LSNGPVFREARVLDPRGVRDAWPDRPHFFIHVAGDIDVAGRKRKGSSRLRPEELDAPALYPNPHQ